MSKTDQFTQTPIMNIPSNSFDLGHKIKITCDAGYVIPVSIVEAIPGDRFSYNNKTFVRLTPMVAPAMTEMDVTTITGFVPWRLIWENSQKFFAEPVPNENTPVMPHFENQPIMVGSLGDYLGLPTADVYDETTGGIREQYMKNLPVRMSTPAVPTGAGIDWFSAGPYAAYQKFFNDWFRDENLYNNGQEIDWKLTDGVNNFSAFDVLRKRAWRHDYFTSALPFAQKGDAVEIPLANFSDVSVRMNPTSQPTGWFVQSTNGSAVPSGNLETSANGTDRTRLGVNSASSDMKLDPMGNLIADTSQLSQDAAVTINTLRWAEKLQVFLEKNARGGTRYTEIVRQHFGVRSSDARLQRAEFLGFSVNPITISEVLQTTPTTDGTTPLGEMGGHGIAYGGSKHVNYFAEEHGFFITFMSIRPKSSYSQGISRMWSRKSPLDFAWPTFAQLGEQEILNREIYYRRDSLQQDPANDEVFGYIPRYAEYRYENDRIAGEMRTTYAHWHQSRIFSAPPALNEDFISCTPSKRIYAVNAAGSHPFIIRLDHDLKVRRCLPKYGIPAL